MTENDSPGTWPAALLRLWTLRRVAEAPRGNYLTVIVGLCAACLAAWVAIDRWQSAPAPIFSLDGMPLLAWYGLAIVGLAALLRACSARPYMPRLEFAPALVIALGAVPVPLLYYGTLAPYLNAEWYMGASAAVAIYVLLYLARGLRAVTAVPSRAAAFAGLLYIAVFVWLTDTLNVIPDVWNPRETATAATDEVAADAEALLFGQAARIDRALIAVGRERAAQPKAFFLGFAGVGDQKVFAEEISLASRVLGERFSIGARSLSLINDERDLERAPLATVSSLQYALRGFAARMNLDEDVLFLSISSHGSKGAAISVANAELPLNDLTDEDLGDALQESGIKWRVIIISACYAGAFIEPLRDSRTIVITAAAADRTSFGCSNDRDLTYFGEAFYRDALPGAHSLRDAFEQARAAIAARERREGVEASNPQAYFGADITKKLAAMQPANP